MKVIEVAVAIADLHYGRKTKSFNKEVLKQRMKIFADNLVNWKRFVNRVGSISGVKIFLLGDIVDGEEVFLGHGYECEMTVDEAIDEAVNSIALFINDICSRFRCDEMKIYCVHGNHGRANRRGSEYSNWDRVVYKILGEKLSYDVEIANNWYGLAKVGDNKILYLHGDCFRGCVQVPLYSISRVVDKWTNSGVVGGFDIVFAGHFHNVQYSRVGTKDVYITGTMLSGDDYSEKKGYVSDNRFWAIAISGRETLFSSLISATEKII